MGNYFSTIICIPVGYFVNLITLPQAREISGPLRAFAGLLATKKFLLESGGFLL